MANAYPISVDNNVRIRDGKNTIGKRKQNVRMLARSSNLFDFTVKGENGPSSIMSVFEKNGKSYVKINALEKFLGAHKEALSANPELAKIFSENGLQIGSNAINVSQTGEEITITIKSKDGKPYVITAGPTSISLDYGTGKDAQHYTYQPEGENCVDVTISRKTVERMLTSEKGNGLFPPVSNIRKIPTTFIGMYMKGMTPNSSVQLGDITITCCVFSKDGTPHCFVKQPKTKTTDDTLFFTDGRFVTCKGLLKQYDPITNSHNIVIESGTKGNPKYFALPIETDGNGKVSPDFMQGYILMTDPANTTFEARPTFDENGDIIRTFKGQNDGGYIINKDIFEDKDNRKYTSHGFTIKPKTYEIFDAPPQNTNDDEIEGDGGAGGGGIFVDPGPQQDGGDQGGGSGIVGGGSSQPEQDDQTPSSDGGNDGNGGNDGGAGNGGNNPPQDEQTPSQDGQNPPQQDSPQVPGQEGPQEPQQPQEPGQDEQTPDNDGGDGGAGNGGNNPPQQPGQDGQQPQPSQGDRPPEGAPGFVDPSVPPEGANPPPEGQVPPEYGPYVPPEGQVPPEYGPYTPPDEQTPGDGGPQTPGGGGDGQNPAPQGPGGNGGGQGPSAPPQTPGDGQQPQTPGDGGPQTPGGNGGGNPQTPGGNGGDGGNGGSQGPAPQGPSADGGGNGGQGVVEGDGSEDDSGSESGSSSSQPAQAPAPKPKKEHVNPYLARYEDLNSAESKAKLKAKNDRFKAGLQTFNTVVGDTLSYVGAFMMLVSLIPGIGLATLIPGLIMGFVGLFQSTFADKLVFSPFRKLHRKLKHYEQEEAEEFEYRDQFIENEKELQAYKEQSQEKVSKLEKMYNAPENGGNEFAHDFARVFNSNGVGFVRGGEHSGVEQLSELGNLNNRIAMTNMLDQIAKTKSPSTRQALVETFTNSYFQDLTTEQRQSISSDLFSPEKNDQLVAYVGALNETNTAQIKEKALEDTQREAISSADSYRLIYLASTKELSEEQRIEMFKRYGTDIVTNNLLRNNGSSEALNDILEAVPEESRAQVAQILNDSAQSMQTNINLVADEAEDNVARHAVVDKMREFADAFVSLQKTGDNINTINECESSVQEYLTAYTLNYNSNGSANDVRSSFNNQFLNNNDHLDVTYTNERAINTSVNNFVANLNAGSEDVKVLSERQKAIYSAIERGGFYKEIASYYASGVMTDGSILPNLSKKEKLGSHTTTSIVCKIGKERLIDVLCDLTGDQRLRSKLSTKNIFEISRDFNIRITSSGNPPQKSISCSYKANGYSTGKAEHLASIEPVMAVHDAVVYFYQSRNAVVAKLVSDDFVAQANTDVNNNGVPIASYDPAKGVYTRTNYNDLTKPISRSEKNIFAEFGKTYPDFNHFSDEVKRKIVLSKLGLDGQRERIEKERAEYLATKKQEEENIDKQIAKGGPKTEELKLQKANLIKERANRESEFNLLLSVYAKADNALTGVINGKFSKAYSELAVTAALDPDGTLTHSQDDVYRKGQEVRSAIKGYNKFRQIVSSLPIPEEDKKKIITDATESQYSGSRLKTSIESVLINHIEEHTVDGQSAKDILETLVDKKGNLSMSKVKKYCAEKHKQLDSRTQLNLTAHKHMLGDEFISAQYKRGAKKAKKGVRQYSDYIEFFTENGRYDEQTRSSVLYPGRQFTDREEFEEQIASDFAMAKTRRAQNKLISRYVSAMGCEKEYKKAKKHITDKARQSKDSKEYFTLAGKMQKMASAYEKYARVFDDLLYSNLSGSFNILDNLTKEDCKALGIDYKEVNKVLQDSKLSSNDKKGKLRTLMAEYEHSITVDALLLSDQVLVADSARAGTTEADRQVARARARYTVEQKALKEFDAKCKAIEEFLENNKNYPYAQDLLNAFATGDEEFFATHPEFDTKGLEFGSRDTYILETLGIDLSEIEGKSKKYDLLGKSERKQQKINAEIRKKNTELLGTFKTTTKKEHSSAAEQSEKQYRKKAENVNQEVKPEERRSHLDKHTSPSLLTSLKALVRGNRVRENLDRELEEQNQTVRERENAKKKKKEAEQTTEQSTEQVSSEELEGSNA